MDKCFCHLNGLAVKDATARKKIDELSTALSEEIESVSTALSEEIESVSTTLSEEIESVSTNLSGEIESVSTTLSKEIKNKSDYIGDEVSELSDNVNVLTNENNEIKEQINNIQTITTVNGVKIRFFVGSQEEYDSLPSELKSNTHPLIDENGVNVLTLLPEIVQSVGNSPSSVMSQKAVTDLFNKIGITSYAKVGSYVYSIGKYLSYDGIFYETPGVYCLDLPVTPGETYLIETGQVAGTMASWCIYDGSGNIILQDTTKYPSSTSVSAKVLIPERASMIRVFGYYNQNISCKKEVNIIPSPLTNKKWVAFGDSLTDPSTLKWFKNYVDFITLETCCEPINLGKGGSGFLKNQNYYSRVGDIPTNTDVITVFGSFNDFSFINEGNLGTAEDDGNIENPTTLGGAMNKFLIDLYNRCPNIKIGFISPICWTWRNPYNGDDREKSESYVSLLENVAKKWSIPYLDLFHTANIRLWDSETSKKYTTNNDGTHLTEEGHKEFIYRKVKNFLETIC